MGLIDRNLSSLLCLFLLELAGGCLYLRIAAAVAARS